ncbi:MAG: adenosine kinase [Alphaproteobacteria bacterium]
MSASFGLCAIGHAIVDVLAPGTDEFLTRENIAKGSMQLIDTARAEELYAKMGSAVEASGGSAANTVAGYASFGGKAAFMGKVADDELGRIFRHDLAALGAHFSTKPMAGTPTARCLIVVTPDSQRSMNTFLGAASEFAPGDLDAAVIAASDIVYLEGYLFDRPKAQEAFFETVKIARAAGKKLALTLSDTFCIARHKDKFHVLIESGIDILFANQNELMALAETSDVTQAIGIMRKKCPLLVTTMGEDGAIICRGEERVKIATEPVEKLIDSTGAGDQFAAGFLYGLAHGHDLATCGRLGAIAAAEVLGHFGPRPERSLADLAREAGIKL